MKVERYLNREVIRHNGYEFNVSTTSADMIAWMGAYACGYRKPRHPLPAVREGFEYALRLGGGVVLLSWKQGVYDVSSRPDRRK